MQNMLDRLRAQRESKVPLKGTVREAAVRVRRPPVLWLANWRAQGSDYATLMLEGVVGWERVVEKDLFADGSPEVEVEFNLMLAVEWLSDKPDFALAVANAIRDNIASAAAAEEAHAGNSSGSYSGSDSSEIPRS